ncbi:hypothetical protein OPV22_015969 [Ensete ventricosum]|uniref:Uncharacterized protein n=1 Tax=Ensete ventricosum TaxID=4639 RepID=A0AAV8RD24_ENSVE|nr:hypothetical protein OPV22_015969 [Ensete ventricosum]
MVFVRKRNPGLLVAGGGGNPSGSVVPPQTRMPCRQLVARPGQVAGPARGSTAPLTPTAVRDKLGPSGTASIERRVDLPICYFEAAIRGYRCVRTGSSSSLFDLLFAKGLKVTSLVFRSGTEPIGKPLRRREFRESEDNMKGAGAAIFHHCNL